MSDVHKLLSTDAVGSDQLKGFALHACIFLSWHCLDVQTQPLFACVTCQLAPQLTGLSTVMGNACTNPALDFWSIFCRISVGWQVHAPGSGGTQHLLITPVCKVIPPMFYQSFGWAFQYTCNNLVCTS